MYKTNWKIALGMLGGIAAVIMLGAFTFRADFSGEWTFDPAKSKASERAIMTPVKMLIAQEKNTMIIQRVSRNPQKENVSLTDNIPLDGNESHESGFPNGSRKTSITWESSDSFSLGMIANGMFEGNTFHVVVEEKWTLSPAHHVLTIERKSGGSHGRVVTRHVYNRATLISRK